MHFPALSDWLLPAALGVAAIALAATPLGQSADRTLFDLSAKLSPASQTSDVVLIAIDAASTAKLGANVWNPEVQALVLERVLSAGARAVGYVQFEVATSSPTAVVHELRDRFDKAGEAVRPALAELDQSIGALERASQAFERLESLVEASDRVFLPVRLDTSPVWISNGIGQMEKMQRAGARVAHVDFIVDVDGRIRSFPIVGGGQSDGALAMPIALAHRAERDNAARYQNASDGRLWLSFPSVARPDVPIVPIADIVANPAASNVVSGKIVLIGSTVGAAASPVMNPGHGASPLAILQAHALSNVLTGKFVVRRGWLAGAAILLCVGTSALAWLLRRASIPVVMATTVSWAAALVVSQVIAVAAFNAWLPSVAPALFALLIPLCTLQPFASQRRRPVPERSASHGDDRLLALAFHEQGQLDHAFDHLRKCPPIEAVLDDLYDLGLDYERRRQYAKAQQVFDYIAARSPQRRELLKRSAAKSVVSESVKIAARPALSNALSDAAEASAPQRLGRYELGRELGRGAMGIVYLGRDTTIGRAVAIKTMPLSQEFDASELESVKKRFFGEAESAGRLNHPSIVTIYDAGEDQDLAYIAMELLTGKDLSRYTAAMRLLPLAVVLNIVARVADALDYAHRLNIVHRDIKPGNIMFDPKTDAVKVTDFGIARITDSNKTKTGMVLGTPSFMSPEQLAGKKIDGQSDLYSLGVTLYQLACGTLPFQAASLAQLMYKISNEPPADPLSHNPSLPDELVAILQKALAKDKQQRFASGAEMALALRDCATHLATVDIAL